MLVHIRYFYELVSTSGLFEQVPITGVCHVFTEYLLLATSWS